MVVLRDSVTDLKPHIKIRHIGVTMFVSVVVLWHWGAGRHFLFGTYRLPCLFLELPCLFPWSFRGMGGRRTGERGEGGGKITVSVSMPAAFVSRVTGLPCLFPWFVCVIQ